MMFSTILPLHLQELQGLKCQVEAFSGGNARMLNPMLAARSLRSKFSATGLSKEMTKARMNTLITF